MEIRQLKYAVAVADAGSFTAAARTCNVAQSALSTQVAALETELGTKLFDRTTRRVRVTDAGQVFLPGARRILELAAELRADMRDIRGEALGTLRIGATQTGSRALDLPAALGSFHHRHPRVRLTMTAGPAAELLQLLVRGDIDIALAAAGSTVPKGARFLPLGPPQALVAVIPSGVVVHSDHIGLAELAALGPFVEFHSGTTLRTMVDDAFGAVGVHREIILELGQLDDVVRCAGNGLGIAIVPAVFTERITAQATVLPLGDDGLSITIGAYTRAGTHSPAVQAALELFAGAADPPGWTQVC